MRDETPINYRPGPGWLKDSMPPEKWNELMSLTGKAMKDYRDLQE